MILQETDALYHSRWELSNSMLGQLDPPYRFQQQYFSAAPTPQTSTPAMDTGAATHMLLLEPDQFKERFAITKKVDGKTKAGKEYNAAFAAEHYHHTILTAAQFDKATAMANAAFSHPAAAELLRLPGLNETTVLFDYPHDGPGKDLKCRGRIDKLIPPTTKYDGKLIDIKTSADASPLGFQRSITKYGYHRQAMFYRDGLAACGDPVYAGAADWPLIWIVIESAPPYCVGVYVMAELPALRGRQLYMQKVDTLGDCMNKNEWPQYTRFIEELHLPEWAYKTYDPTEVIE